MKSNLASVKVLEKIGMTAIESIEFNGEAGVTYQITKWDYEHNRNQSFPFRIHSGNPEFV